MYKGFGLASFIFPILLILTGLHYFLSLSIKKLWNKWFWGLVAVLWISLALGFFAEESPLLGGLVGYEMNLFMKDYLGGIGVLLILLFLLVVIAVRLFNFSPEAIGQFFNGVQLPKKPSTKTNKTTVSTEGEVSFELNNAKDEEQELTDTFTHKKDIPPIQQEAGLDVNLPQEEPTEDIAFKVEEVVKEDEVDVKAQQLVDEFGEFDPKLELGNYKFPPIELLDAHGAGGGITINQEELEENKNKIVSTLKNYKIGIAQIKATIGPTVTLYEIVPEAGVRISKIKNLEDDIALSLAALGIRIIAPIPGKGTIGIEVPNKKASIVSMRSVIGSSKFQKT